MPLPRLLKTPCLGLLALAAMLAAGCIEHRTAEEKRDTLIYGFESTFRTFDPARQVYAQETVIMSQVLEGLVRWGPDLTLEPALATDWTLSEDGLTWTFHLREGVTFHDGTPFNADAVKWHFDRILDPSTASTRRTLISDIDRLEVVDDHTIIFHMQTPNTVIIERFGSAFAFIQSPTAFENDPDSIAQRPVGTGPYMFDEWRADVHIRFVRNPDHWDADSYHIERLEFRPIRENTTRLILLEQGVLDMADVAFPHVNVAEGSNDVLLQTVPRLDIRYIGMNTQKPPFDDIRVRQAANYAVNKEDLIEYVFFGVGEPATGPLPSVLEAYNPDIHIYTYDPDRARELLAEAGYPDGVDVVMWTHESGLYRVAADAVADYLRRVGIRVSIQIYDNAAYSSKFDEYITRTGEWYPTKDGVFDMYLGGWGGGETAHGYLEPLLESYSYSNNSFYINDELDELLASYKTIVDDQERNDAYRRMQEIVVEDAPWIFAFHGQINIGYNSRVRGFRIHPSGRLFFENVRVVDDED